MTHGQKMQFKTIACYCINECHAFNIIQMASTSKQAKERKTKSLEEIWKSKKIKT